MANVVQLDDPLREIFSGAIDRYQKRKMFDAEQQQNADRTWLSAQSELLQKMDRTQQMQYLTALASRDPDRFRRVFNVDPDHLSITPTPEETYKDDLNTARSKVVTGQGTGPYDEVYRGNLLTSSHTADRVQTLQALDGLDGREAAQAGAATEHGLLQSADQSVRSDEDKRHHRADESNDRMLKAAEAAYARAGVGERASQTDLNRERITTSQEERTPGSARQQYVMEIDTARAAAGATGSKAAIPRPVLSKEKELERAGVAYNKLNELSVSGRVLPEDVEPKLTEAADRYRKVQAELNRMYQHYGLDQVRAVRDLVPATPAPAPSAPVSAAAPSAAPRKLSMAEAMKRAGFF